MDVYLFINFKPDKNFRFLQSSSVFSSVLTESAKVLLSTSHFLQVVYLYWWLLCHSLTIQHSIYTNQNNVSEDWLKMIEEDKNELMTFQYILYSKVKIDIILLVSFTRSLRSATLQGWTCRPSRAPFFNLSS